jgi:hypothetical protein
MVGRPAVRLERPPYSSAYGGAGAPPGKPQENQKAKGKNQKAKISELCRGPDWGGIFAV